jgi:hypothetical protein
MFDDVFQMMGSECDGQGYDGSGADAAQPFDNVGADYQTMPNPWGGVNVFGGGHTITTSPNAWGGVNIHDTLGQNLKTEHISDLNQVSDEPEQSQGLSNEIISSSETTFLGSCDSIYLDPDTLVENEIDPVNNVVVHGNVQSDAQFVQGQTTDSCALMAQEQFIEKYYGEKIPEQELIDFATDMNVYSPGQGTNPMGWDLLLNRFEIDHTHLNHARMDDLVTAVESGNDAFIAVDAAHFYDDPTIPSGSGHAVVVTGDGQDPQTGEVRGFYVNDTNHPGTPLYKTIAEMNECWYGQMISVPDPSTTKLG